MRPCALRAALCGVMLLNMAIEASASEQALAPLPGTWFSQNGPIWIRFREASTVRIDGARAAGVKAIPQNDATMSNSIGYNFTPNISAQLVLGALTSTHVENQDGVKLGKTSFGAPSVVVDYRFTELGAIQPFVGVGAMYLFFYEEKGAALSSLKVRDSLGAILRTGVEVMFNRNFGVYVAANKVFIDSSAQARLGANRVDAKIEFDPWIMQTGVTYRF